MQHVDENGDIILNEKEKVLKNLQLAQNDNNAPVNTDQSIMDLMSGEIGAMMTAKDSSSIAKNDVS